MAPTVSQYSGVKVALDPLWRFCCIQVCQGPPLSYFGVNFIIMLTMITTISHANVFLSWWQQQASLVQSRCSGSLGGLSLMKQIFLGEWWIILPQCSNSLVQHSMKTTREVTKIVQPPFNWQLPLRRFLNHSLSWLLSLLNSLIISFQQDATFWQKKGEFPTYIILNSILILPVSGKLGSPEALLQKHFYSGAPVQHIYCGTMYNGDFIATKSSKSAGGLDLDLSGEDFNESNVGSIIPSDRSHLCYVRATEGLC